MEIIVASESDYPAILNLQKLCYQQEAAIYNDNSIPPLTQTEKEIVDECRDKTVLKLVDGNRIIGSIRASEKDGTCHVVRVIVHPDYQNRGLGTRLLLEIEKYFPHSKRFELFTGFRSDKNLYLYQKHGYRQFKEEQISETFRLVYLEKHV